MVSRVMIIVLMLTMLPLAGWAGDDWQTWLKGQSEAIARKEMLRQKSECSAARTNLEFSLVALRAVWERNGPSLETRKSAKEAKRLTHHCMAVCKDYSIRGLYFDLSDFLKILEDEKNGRP